MSALFFAMAGVERWPTICFYVGLALCSGRPRCTSATALRNDRAHTLKLSLTDALYSPLPSQERKDPMDTFPDLGSLSDQELKDLIQQLTEEELEISYRRRILHGKIDILRAELVNRLRKKHEGGEDVITGADVAALTDILAGRAPGGGRRPVQVRAGERVAVHCPECGFVNAEGANYCPKCGALHRRSPRADEPRRTTATYRIDEDRRDRARRHRGRRGRGAALVIRAGGGRVGETFPLTASGWRSAARPSRRSSSTT